MKPTDRLLTELYRASRRATRPEQSDWGDPAFAARLAGRWAAGRAEPDMTLLWETLSRRAARGLAVLALLAGLTTWAEWHPAPVEPDTVLESELLALLPSP